jgi:ABC-type transport system substrate-binding protein
MKNHRSILCALLAIAMVLSFGSCTGTAGKGGVEEPAPPETARAEPAPSGTAPEEPPAAVTEPSDPPEDRPDLVILSREEYVNRPRGIQEGTVFSFGIVGALSPYGALPWNVTPAGWLTGSVFEGLLYMYMNDPGDIRGCIAESWEHSDDYLTWTFHIRGGVTFTNGSPCDAAAVEKAWDYISKEQQHYFANNNIESWESSGSGKFVVRLSAPCPWFEAAMCGGGFSVVDPYALTLYGPEDVRAAVGTGPYFIDNDKYDPENGIVLNANAAYYLEERMPCIQTGVFKPFGSAEEALNALIGGEIDGTVIGSPWKKFFTNSHYTDGHQYLLEEGYPGRIAVCPGASNPMWLNAKQAEIFTVPEVREAMCRFIDFASVNEQAFAGLGSVQDSLWAKGSSAYVRAEGFYCDPDEGLRLLASAGLEPSDISFEVVYYEEEVLLAVQRELEAVGVDMRLKPYDPSSSFTSLTREPVSFINPGYSNTSPYGLWKLILPPGAPVKLCWQDIYDPGLYQAMLDEYDAMSTALTWDDMLSHCRQITKYVQDDFGAIGGVQAPVLIALNGDFKNGVYFTENCHIQLYYLYK